MKQQILTIFFLLLTVNTFAQPKVRAIGELLDKDKTGWSLVTEWIKTAKNKVEVLPVDSANAKDALVKLQVTTRSPMGAIVYETGGVLIDNGWIRILGSGNEKLKRSLPDWNKGKSFAEFGQQPSFLLIADDAVGGFFLVNGGGLGTDLGKVYYFSPDNLEYEPLDLSYSEFLIFCFNSDLNEFYENLRWKTWKADVANLQGDSVFSFFPYLWSKQGEELEKTAREAVPIEEQYNFNLDARKQLGLDK